jgi:hypothetical protein
VMEISVSGSGCGVLNCEVSPDPRCSRTTQYQSPVLRPSCVPQKVGVKKGVYQTTIFLEETSVSVTDRSQPKGVKRKMPELKLRSGVHWQGALKRKGMEQSRGTQSE